MKKKLPPTKTYYSITEVERMTKVKAHVLRYWEAEFPTLRPKKNRAGNRCYQMPDVRQVLLIKHLLYEEGFTIDGARRRLNKRDPKDLAQIAIPFQDVKRDEILLSLREGLKGLLKTLGPG
jgi:DNA-binding transcriptional MerR regulator